MEDFIFFINQWALGIVMCIRCINVRDEIMPAKQQAYGRIAW